MPDMPIPNEHDLQFILQQIELAEAHAAATGEPRLKPGTSWFDFVLAMSDHTPLIHFIAAYGTHPTLVAATSAEDRHKAATLLVLGGPGAPADRIDYLDGTGAWAEQETGLNLVDFWTGELAALVENNPEPPGWP
jgi:hypothetical protein